MRPAVLLLSVLWARSVSSVAGTSPLSSPSQSQSLLLFGTVTLDSNVSRCARVAAVVDYVRGARSETAGVEGARSWSWSGSWSWNDGVAGTVVCDNAGDADARESPPISYLISVPVSTAALASSSHALVKLYGLQTSEDVAEIEREGGNRMLVVKQAVMIPRAAGEYATKLNVDVDMAVGVRVDGRDAVGALASSFDGAACRAMMDAAFGDAVWRTTQGDVGGVALGDGDQREARDGACRGPGRPTLACAGIGVGTVVTVVVLGTTIRACAGGQWEERKEAGGPGDPEEKKKKKKSAETGQKEDETPEKRVMIGGGPPPGWKREGDRLRRDVKRVGPGSTR